MCILFIAINQHEQYPLIIAANRDEYHARPSEPMHYWPDQPDILAGRDSRAGGTWFGVNRNGLFAAVTNYRAPGLTSNQARSRGELVTRFLRNLESTENFGSFLCEQHTAFSPFNLVYGEHGKLFSFSSIDPVNRPLESGFHSISNGAIDELWPKMSRGVSLLKDRISSSPGIDSEDLVQMMKDQTRADKNLIPDTGLDPDREQHLSSIFIQGDDYGTRTTTLLLGSESQFDLYEYNYSAQGSEINRRHYLMAVKEKG